MDEKIFPINYYWKEDLQTIEFQYKDIKYNFRVLMGGQSNIRVLKNPEEQIIILTKKQ